MAYGTLNRRLIALYQTIECFLRIYGLRVKNQTDVEVGRVLLLGKSQNGEQKEYGAALDKRHFFIFASLS